jgi:DNA-binding CsgD family transcriptional regulator
MNILQLKEESIKNTKEYKVLELYYKNLTNKQISKKLGYTEKSILAILAKHKLPSHRSEEIIETNELMQFIIGSILGDGSLSKLSHGKHNSRLRVAHCLRQSDYCIWKANLLKKYNLLSQVRYDHTFDSRFKEPDYTIIKMSSIAHPIFTKYRQTCYKNDKFKSVNIDIVKKIDPLGLAIWYMDDGSRTACSMTLSTNSFSQEELLILVDILYNNFKLKFSIHKAGILYLKSECWERFVNLIEEYILPCMKYKI